MPILLTSEQYDEIMFSYQRARFKRSADIAERTQKVYEAIPKLSEIDKEITAFVRLGLKEKNTSRARETIEGLHQKKTDLLVAAGFSPDYLDPEYTCPDCQDTGYVEGERCHCFKQKIIDTIYSDVMWQEIFKTDNFEAFNLELYDDSTVSDISGRTPREAAAFARDTALDFINKFSEPKDSLNNLLIYGHTGTGKTFLCNCIAKELIYKGYFVVNLSASSLVEIFERVTFQNKSKDIDFSTGSKDFNFANLFDCDLLIIDDLGAEYYNSFTNAKILDLLNNRLNHYKPTIISTNLDSNELASTYSERMISRIIGRYIWLRLDGDDIRLKKRLDDK